MGKNTQLPVLFCVGNSREVASLGLTQGEFVPSVQDV
jgi:hypothetical protein